MQTLTEIVAAVVVSSSAAAYSHFGVTLDAQQVEKPVPVERTVARTVDKETPRGHVGEGGRQGRQAGPRQLPRCARQAAESLGGFPLTPIGVRPRRKFPR
jgi:hypothetical protein